MTAGAGSAGRDPSLLPLPACGERESCPAAAQLSGYRVRAEPKPRHYDDALSGSPMQRRAGSLQPAIAGEMASPPYAGQYGSNGGNAILGWGGRVAMPEPSNGCDCAVDWRAAEVGPRRGERAPW